MAELKSAFMGGYSKKSVKACVSQLETENENLKQALDLAEHNALKADRYYNENKQLGNEISRLNGIVSELEQKLVESDQRLAESEKSNNDYISNIGQIFYSAYESGAKITDDAKDGSQEFLQKLDDVANEAKAEAQKAINAYNLINTDIKALLANLTKEINAVSANTDAMIKKATEVASAMDNIHAITSKNNDKAAAIAEEYKEFFDSFSNDVKNDKATAPKTEQPTVSVVETPAVQETPVAQTVQVTQVAQPAQPAQVAQTTQPTQVAQPAQAEPVKVIEKKEEPTPNPATPFKQILTQTVQQSSPAQDAAVKDDNRTAMLRDILKRVSNNDNQ